MSTKIEFDSTIKRGLPVIVEAAIYPAEPDVGIFDRQVEITQIRFTNGRPVPNSLFDYAMTYDRDDLIAAALEYE